MSLFFFYIAALAVRSWKALDSFYQYWTLQIRAFERGNLEENRICSTSVKQGRVMINMLRYFFSGTGKRDILIVCFIFFTIQARKDLSEEYNGSSYKADEEV